LSTLSDNVREGLARENPARSEPGGAPHAVIESVLNA